MILWVAERNFIGTEWNYPVAGAAPLLMAYLLSAKNQYIACNLDIKIL